MTWKDFHFLHTQSFGKGVHRPYADYIGDVAFQFDNLLGNDVALAHFTTILKNRDLILFLGKKISLLCFSSSMHQHYPFRQIIEWDEYFLKKEEQFISEIPNIDKNTTHIKNPDIESQLIDQFHFTNPCSIIFPSVFQGQRESEEWKTRTLSIEESAKILIAFDRELYEKHIEMQKPKCIFLSHKSSDKSLVREVASTLQSIGLDPWLDEDKMKAGANLERSILQGFDDSCAAVFFITKNFVDDNYLETEIDYALAQKRVKGERFQIITLLIASEDGSFGKVPPILHRFVWKEVTPIQITRNIAEALPIKCGTPNWRD